MAVLMIFIIFRFKTHIKNAHQNYLLCNFMACIVMPILLYNQSPPEHSKSLADL